MDVLQSHLQQRASWGRNLRKSGKEMINMAANTFAAIGEREEADQKNNKYCSNKMYPGLKAEFQIACFLCSGMGLSAQAHVAADGLGGQAQTAGRLTAIAPAVFHGLDNARVAHGGYMVFQTAAGPKTAGP